MYGHFLNFLDINRVKFQIRKIFNKLKCLIVGHVSFTDTKILYMWPKEAWDFFRQNDWCTRCGENYKGKTICM